MRWFIEIISAECLQQQEHVLFETFLIWNLETVHTLRDQTSHETMHALWQPAYEYARISEGCAEKF